MIHSLVMAQQQAIPLDFESISIENGLPNDWVPAILQDREGFMWFGTRSGLVRYDGYEFQTHIHDPADSTSISGNFVEVIYEDRAGNLWVGTRNSGLNKFDKQSGVFTKYYHDEANPTSLSSNQVSSIIEDSEGFLWVGTSDNGANKLNVRSGEVVRYIPDQNDRLKIPEGQVFYLHEDKEGMIWIVVSGISSESEQGGLARIDTKTDRIVRYDLSDIGTEFRIFTAHEGQSGKLWFGGRNGAVYSYNYEDEVFTYHDFIRRSSRAEIAGEVRDIFEVTPGELWFTDSRESVFRLHVDSGTFQEFSVEKEDSGFVYTWAFLLSHDDTFWVSTLLGGIKKRAGTRTSGIKYWNMMPVTALHAYRPDSLLIAHRIGNLWMHKVSDFQTDMFSSAFTLLDSYQFPFGTYGITSIIEDHAGYTWVGTSDGINRLDLEKETFQYFLVDEDEIDNEDESIIYTLLEDSSHRLWVGTRDGLLRYDQNRTSLTRFKHDPDDSASLKHNIIYSIHEDIDGSVWIGSFGGLNRYVEEGRELESYLPDGISVYTIASDDQDRMWFGSSSGLWLSDQSTGSIEPRPVEVDLPSNIIYNILCDPEGNLWLQTSAGLFKYDVRTALVQDYNSLNGTPSQTYSDPMVLDAALTDNGMMYFGSTSGLIAFELQDAEPNPVPPIVYIKTVSATGDDVYSRGEYALNSPDAFELQNTQNDLAIEYVGLHYKAPDQNKYRYILEGYDREWVDAGSQRVVRYPRLPSGNYVFRIMAANSDGVWSEPTTMNFTILPPWWRTWWAYAFYGLLFVSGIFAVDRIQRRRLIAKEREKTRERELAQAKEIEQAYTQLKSTQQQLIQQEKMASLGQLTSGIAHEIKNPLNFVNNFARLNKDLVSEIKEIVEPGEELDELLGDLEANSQQIAKHGDRADRIVKSMMQHASDNNGQRYPVEINALVDEFVNLSYSSFQSQVSDVDVEIEKQLDAEAGTVNISPQDIGRVLQNVLSNAFEAVAGQTEVRSPKSGVVRVSTKRVKESVEIRVSDNGPGIPVDIRDKIFEPFFTTKPTGSGTGLGLSLSYDIVTQGHGGSFEVESEEGEGATFIVRLPANYLTGNEGPLHKG